MEFPHVDLPVDLIAWTDVTEDILNIYKQSCRLKACIFALCTEGSITVSINLMDTEIKQGDFIILLPGTIIQFHGQKEKVRICFAGFSEHCLNGVNIIQSTMSSYSKIIEAPVIPLNETVASYFRDYFALLARISTGPYMPKTRMAQNVLDTLLYGVNELYSSRPDSQNRIKSRKEEICREFIQLVIENYTTRTPRAVLCRETGHIAATPQHHHQAGDREECAGPHSACRYHRHKSQAEIHGHDHPGDSLFAELPQRLVLRQVFSKRHLGMSPLEYRNS